MKWLESLIYFLFPTLHLHATPWFGLWQSKDQLRATRLSRIYLIALAAAYVIHYLLIEARDTTTFTPPALWATYRLGSAALALCLYLLTYWSVMRSARLTRVPFFLMALVSSNLQAASMLWYDKVPFVYGLIFSIIGTAALQTTQLKSAFVFAIIYSSQLLWFLSAGVPAYTLVSGAVFGLGTVLILRAGTSVEVAAFIAEQERLEAHKKLIESELELNSEIRSFLPNEIYNRVVNRIQNRRMSVLQAMDEELRPREALVACVFSDIRGYTQKSKDIRGYLYQSALPNIRLCTEVVEAHRGIPHLVGDLVFSYFDLESEKTSIWSALSCAAALVGVNDEWNKKIDESNRVSRFVLVSFGKAIVGNIGGISSSREITAMGPAVNILSRIDPLTKDPVLQARIGSASIILTREAADTARSHLGQIELREISLAELGLGLRDFPEERSIWIMPLDLENEKHLAEDRPMQIRWERQYESIEPALRDFEQQ